MGVSLGFVQALFIPRCNINPTGTEATKIKYVIYSWGWLAFLSSGWMYSQNTAWTEHFLKKYLIGFLNYYYYFLNF